MINSGGWILGYVWKYMCAYYWMRTTKLITRLQSWKISAIFMREVRRKRCRCVRLLERRISFHELFFFLQQALSLSVIACHMRWRDQSYENKVSRTGKIILRIHDVITKWACFWCKMHIMWKEEHYMQIQWRQWFWRMDNSHNCLLWRVNGLWTLTQVTGWTDTSFTPAT